MTQCLWRSAALAALERAGRRFKIVSTSSDDLSRTFVGFLGRRIAGF
jgi:hypothetical protein